ncbi:MAG: hypothetical protein IJ155_04500 [Prevotella sp.]|nr:hypothetical protein [Prevotella sp.]
MWNDDDRKWLYEQMKAAGVNTGTYDDFTKSLNNKEDRDWYYNKSRSLGLNVGSSDDFAGMMVEPVVQSQQTEQPVQRVDTNVVKPVVQTFTQEQIDSMEHTTMPSDTVQQQGAQFKNAAMTSPNRVAPDVDEEQEKARQREAELQEAYAERKRLADEEPKYRRSVTSMYMSSYGAPMSDEDLERAKKHDAILAAQRQLDERIATLEESRDKNTSGFWRNLWRTVTNLSTWSFGLIPLSDALTANRVASKLENDSELTDEEETLLQQMVKNNEAQEQYGDDKGFMARAGSITGEALPFVAEFVLTGGYSGVAEASGGAATRMLAKATATDLTMKGVRSWLVKATGTAVGDVAAAGLMANTTGAGKTVADAMDRHRGTVIQDEDGDYHFGHYEADENGDMQFVDGGKTWAQSIYEAEAANTLEYYTEMLGTHMEKPLGAAGKWVADKTGLNAAGKWAIQKMGLAEVSKDLSQITANGYGRAMKHVLERGGIQDYPSEVLEEEANIILNSMFVGDNSMSDLVDGRTQADIWGGMLFSVGFMNSPAVAGGTIDAASYLRTKHNMENADKVASFRMTDARWKPIRDRIDNTSNEDFADLATEILNDESLVSEEKKAILNYMGQLAKYRGYNVGSTAKAKDEANNQADEGTAEVTSGINTSYIGGYEVSDERKNDIKNAYDFHLQRVRNVIGDERMLDEDPVGTIMSMHGDSFTDEDRQTAIDYVNAKAAYDGMIHRVQDDMDGRIAISDAAIESRRHHEDGQIHPATLSTDEKVYIVGGNVLMNEDGTMIDREASRAVMGGDNMILVANAETGAIEARSIEEFLSVDAPLDAAKEKEEAQAAIRREYAQQAANTIDGVLPFNDGDTYTATDEQGQPHTVVVVPNGTANSQGQILQAGEGEVLVSWDGAEPAPMSREVIQDMVENTNLARLQQFEQEKAERRAVEAEAEREASRPVYNINDEVTLQTEEGQVRGSITAEANEDGLIEVWTESPIGGKKINLYNRDQLDGMVVEHNGAQQTVEPPSEEPQGTVTPATDAQGTVVTTEELQPTGEAAGTTEAVEPMPMVGEGEDAEPDFSQVEPTRAHTYIYNEAGLSRDEANQFVEANKKAADKELEKIQGKKPKMGTSLAKYRKETAEWEQNVDVAQQKADYWKQVKDEQASIVAAERAAQSERDAGLHDQAVIDEQARQAEELRKREEQAQLGTNAVAQPIRDRWQAAPKVEGAQNEIVLANGEKVQGRYMLVESGAATPSHNPRAEFTKNEGFPVDANGQSVNDRDYERDQDAQQTTRQIASVYDQRALQTPVVVSQDGVVLSGNGRTMAGELAAQNGTDGAYIEHLKKYGQQFGFTPEQVEGMQHPRVLFVPDEAMPYTAETFAKFNAQEMKGQSKTEQAVKLGKIVDDDTFSRVVRSINAYETLGEFYADPSATTGAINELRDSGAISQAQYTEMFDGDGISAQGREILENMLIGKAFESNPDAVRQITAFKGVRQGIITALGEISNNLMLGRDYSHESELAQAINLVYQARQNGYKQGDKVSGFARQQNLFAFDEGATVADYTNATVLMYADLLNEGRPTLLKKALALYNQAAQESANGQMDIFSGGVKTQDEILNDVRQLLKYGTEEEQQAALAAAAAERMAAAIPTGERTVTAASIQTDGSTGTEHQGSEATRGVVDSVQPAQLTDESEAEEAALRSRIEELTDEETTEDTPDGVVYHRPILIDGKHQVEQIDAPDKKGDYTGSYYVYDGQRFGGLPEVIAHIDGKPSTDTTISRAEREVNTSPTPAQKEAGNYKKGHVKIDGFDVTIENPRGSERSGTDASGREWRQTMHNTYGYIRGTEGVDGDHIDVFLSDNPESGNVYVIDQRNADGSFDEHKVMYGFNSADEARAAYLSNYEEGWQGLGAITEVSKDEFKKWVNSSHRKTKPFSEYKSVRAVGGQNEGAAIPSQQTEEEPQPVGRGVFGNIYDQFKGKAKEAIAFLRKRKEGVAKGALHHRQVGDIDIVWGDENRGLAHIDNKHTDVASRLQEVLDGMSVVSASENRIVLDSPTHRAVVSKDWYGKPVDNWLLTAYEKKNGVSGGSIDIVPEPEGKQNGTAPLQNASSLNDGLPNEAAAVSTLGSSAETLTDANRETTPISDLRGSVSANTTDTNRTAVDGKRNDTATPQNTVSEGKGTKKSDTVQENGEKTSSYSVTEDEDSDVHFRDDEEEDIEAVNERFNEQLNNFTLASSNDYVFDLGSPSLPLLAAGVEDKPIRLYGSKVAAKMRKHGFKASELRDLPYAVAHPIAVFDNLGKPGNRSVLTELKTEQGNFLVTIDLGKGTDVDFDIVGSVFGKRGSSVVEWINKGFLRYVDKEKALNYLHLSAPIAEASNNPELDSAILSVESRPSDPMSEPPSARSVVSESSPLRDQQRTNLADVEYLDLDSAAKVIENFENPKLSEENLREGEEVALVQQHTERMRKRTAARERKAMEFAQRQWRRAHDLANEWAQKLGLTDVMQIVDSIEDVEGNESFSSRKRRAKGWYDPKTGKIVIVLGNNRSPSDVLETILHEAVGHYWLRRLFGQNFDTFLDNVYQAGSLDIKERIADLAVGLRAKDSGANRTRRSNDEYLRIATEEYLAGLAESTDFEDAENRPWVHHWFNKIKELFLQMLGKIGLRGFDKEGVELSDNELRYILWRSFKNLSEPGRYRNVFDVAENTSMEVKLGVGNGAKVIRMGPFEDEIPLQVMNRKDEEKIRQRVAHMTASEALEAYQRINDNMRDENGLDLDEHFEKTKRDWIADHGIKGVGKQQADEFQKATDKYGSGMVELRWALKDRLDELGVDVAREESRMRDEEDANNRFNNELDAFKNKKHQGLLHLGHPGAILRATGVDAAEMTLSPTVLHKHLKKHGLTTDDLKGLAESVQSPILVYKHGENHPNLVVVTEMNVKGGKLSITLELDKDGHVVEISNIKSIHSKEASTELDRLSELGEETLKESLRWVDKGKVSNWLLRLPYEGERTESNPKLDSVAKVINNFENPKLSGENFDEGGVLFRDGEDEGSGVDVGREGFDEWITRETVRLASEHKDSLQMRINAMKAIGGNLSKLRQAMSRQREYDRETVNRVVRLARMLMDTLGVDSMTRGEVRKLTGLIAGAAGKEDIMASAKSVVDLMLSHQLRELADMLHRQLSVRGTKLNGSGVEVQGRLDIEGKRMVDAMKEGMSLSADALDERIADCLDRMGGVAVAQPQTGQEAAINRDAQGQEVADVSAKNAAVDYQGYLLAKKWHDAVKVSEEEEMELKHQLKDAKEQLKSGEMERAAYREFEQATDDALRENRLSRMDGYYELLGNLGDGLGSSIARAKAWRDREMARVRDVQHNANSDMQGRSASEHSRENWGQKLSNLSIVRFFLKPLATFDQMLRLFGGRHVNGEGYLWKRFMGGYTDASDREWRELKRSHERLDEKVSEVFGRKMRWSDLFAVERKLPGMEVEFWDGGEKVNHELTQGNMLYIYMVNKMSDGRMKLRKMGITESDVEAILERLDPRFVELGDWIQDVFLKEKRNEYNKVHERLFGASMAAIGDYFPLVINSRSRGKEEDVGEPEKGETQPATITGAIIKRTKNSLALDVTGADAFDVVLAHLQQMEHWAAFAELNHDLNTLLSYRKFRNRVLNMTTVQYGSGETLWQNFKDVCRIAAGVYRPMVSRNSLDSAMVNVAKGVTQAKISFRLYTALKQLLSYPAYLSEASVVELAKTTLNPLGAVRAWNWAMSELPGFSKRWQSRRGGDSRLQETDADWRFWKNKLVETAGRWGMTPNAFIDGLTVAMGAKAIYETKLKSLKKAGYSDSDAKDRALRAAAVSYNETQQSSENAYLSAMQLDRTVASVALTVFRNASMAYQRRLTSALRNLKHKLTPGYRDESIAFMEKQMMRDGLSEAQARKAAVRAYNRSWYRDVADVALFGFVMQLAWNLGPYLPYLLLGDGDDDKDEMKDDAVMHALAGGVEGLTAGNVMSDLYNMKRKGDDVSNYQFNLLPLMSDVQSMVRHMKSDEVQAANDLLNLLVQSGVGVNPQTFSDVWVALMDYGGGNSETGRDFGLLLLRLLQVPQSQADKYYLDELGMNGREARGEDLTVLAERYAKYKVSRGAAMLEWVYGEGERSRAENRYLKKFEDMRKERVLKGLDPDDMAVIDDYKEGEYRRWKSKRENVRLRYVHDADRLEDVMSELADRPEEERRKVYDSYVRKRGNLLKSGDYEGLDLLTMETAAYLSDTEPGNEYMEPVVRP